MGAPEPGSPESGTMIRNSRRRPIYLDYQATTPVDPLVLEAMLPYFTHAFGNAHSSDHAYGREAAEAVEMAREQVARLIGAEAREIVFTSGATESNNLAIQGAAHFRRQAPSARDHVVTVVSEHKCVLESCRRLEQQGFPVTYLPVGPDGLVDLDQLAAAVDERTALVSVMAANNEIGVLQPMAEIAQICRAKGAWLHSDAAQAFGKIPLDMAALGLDLLSISGHKIYGPKGVGALYVRRRPRVRLEPLMLGGGQERGLRSGTLPVPLCVGLGKAASLAGDLMAGEAVRLRALRDRFMARLQAGVVDVRLHGHGERRLAGNLNLGFPGVDTDGLLAGLGELAVSTGSACMSASVEPSYVLKALGVPPGDAALRIGFGRMTSEGEVDEAARMIALRVAALRAGVAGARHAAGGSVGTPDRL